MIDCDESMERKDWRKNVKRKKGVKCCKIFFVLTVDP